MSEFKVQFQKSAIECRARGDTSVVNVYAQDSSLFF